MRIDADEQWTVDALLPAIRADRLADRQNVVLIETAVERRAAMPGRPERHPLRWILQVGLDAVIGIKQLADIHPLRGLRRLARERADLCAHQCSSCSLIASA